MDEPEREAGRPASAPDPWAPGGAMSSHPISIASRVALDDGEHDPTAGSRPADSPSGRLRVTRRRVVGGAVAVVAIGVGTMLATVDRGDGPTATDTTIPAASEPSTDERVDVALDAPTDLLERLVIDTDVIDLPDALRSVAPTEVVALSPDRGLVEISLPSGRVRTTDLRFPTGTARLAVTDFGSIVWTSTRSAIDSTTAQLIEPGRQPIGVVGESNVATVTATAGRDQFIVWPDPSGAPRSIDAAGADDGLDPARFGGDTTSPLAPAGGLLDQATGGVFRSDATGSRRVSTGDLLTTGRNHMLLHECDDDRRCRLVTIQDTALQDTALAQDAAPEADGGLRRTTSAFETRGFPDDHPIWSPTPGGLSPDGTAFLAVSDWERRELAIVSTASGDVETVHGSPTFELNATWASDSSGVFFADGDLRFYRRDDRSVTPVSEALGPLRAVVGRVPADTAACEIVGVIVDRFERVRSGDAIGAPSEPAFDGLARFAPPALVDETAALRSFVGTFVSAERSDSERIENWPATVRAGVDAIERYAASEC